MGARANTSDGRYGARRRVGALALTLALTVAPASGAAPRAADDGRSAPAARAGLDREVLARLAALMRVGSSSFSVRPPARRPSNVEPADDPHAAGVAFDRVWDAPGSTPGERQLALDAARRLGAVPKYFYATRRSRDRGDERGYCGDLGHIEWDPVEFGYPCGAALVLARRARTGGEGAP